ncbi:hypothetical protein [Bacillus piscicola]|uniref:hypothetical protein n=1 Tax=Bacillus piscicola TaxID=1632684 RepID=UPI001F091B10|nr:hypothetical protein [Bacillus piscicola]
MVLFWSTIILLNIGAFVIPKNLPTWQLYATSVFAVLFQQVVDNYFDFEWDLYGYFEKGVDGFMGLVYIFGIFPAANIIFLTGWQGVVKKSAGRKISYLVMWVILASAYEHFAVQSGFLYYNGWQLLYSTMEYPVIFLVLIVNLIILQRLSRGVRT